jgi:hypothetical protein
VSPLVSRVNTVTTGGIHEEHAPALTTTTMKELTSTRLTAT